MNLSKELEVFGYDSIFEEFRVSHNIGIESLARVAAEHKGAYEVVNETGEYRALVSGKFMANALSRKDYPAVGDWVVIKVNNEIVKTIDSIVPRQTVLKKKYAGKDEAQLIAANIDAAFIVESIDRDYNINRFERYAVLVSDGGVRPVFILNKCDLIQTNELDEKIEQLHTRFKDIDVICTSAIKDDGLDDLIKYIKNGLTYCFLGSSGVGKSSIINRLLNENKITVKAIGSRTNRGRHTTTSREMYFLNNGAIIIDNPGSREVGVTDSNFGVDETFVDIKKLSHDCKFKDCKHRNESGCAILKAVNSGMISESQYNNYTRLQKEVEHYEMNNYDKRQKDKKFGKFIKQAKADFEKYN